MLLFERGHHLIDSLARRADQAGYVALGQADGDRDGAIGTALAVLAGERLNLARDTPVDIERAERLNALVGQAQPIREDSQQVERNRWHGAHAILEINAVEPQHG